MKQDETNHLSDTEFTYSIATTMSISQTSFAGESIDDFTISSSPPIPARLPDGLTTLANGRYVQYDNDRKDIFLEWWSRTYWFTLNSRRPEREQTKLNWGEKNKLASYWQYFYEVAILSSGTPKVWCRRCEKELGHPNCKAENKDGVISQSPLGNSGLITHLKSRGCKDRAEKRELPALSVHELMSRGAKVINAFSILLATLLTSCYSIDLFELVLPCK